MSWKPEVEVDGKFYDNRLTFVTEEEAKKSAADKFADWILCTNHKAVESEEPVTHKLDLETGELTQVAA